MSSNKPRFTLRLEQETIDKLQEVAKIENRSCNMQIEKILLDFLKDYEETNGIIELNKATEN